MLGSNFFFAALKKRKLMKSDIFLVNNFSYVTLTCYEKKKIFYTSNFNIIVQFCVIHINLIYGDNNKFPFSHLSGKCVCFSMYSVASSYICVKRFKIKFITCVIMEGNKIFEKN